MDTCTVIITCHSVVSQNARSCEYTFNSSRTSPRQLPWTSPPWTSPPLDISPLMWGARPKTPHTIRSIFGMGDLSWGDIQGELFGGGGSMGEMSLSHV